MAAEQNQDDEARAAGGGGEAKSGETGGIAEDAPRKEPSNADEGPPAPDPETCKGIVLCLSHFESSATDGEWDDTDLRFYLEPAGVLQAKLRCERCEQGNELGRGGIFMTRPAWQARTVYLSSPDNPETYELAYPREYGYVKNLSHYQPQARKSAKYPWSKKY